MPWLFKSLPSLVHSSLITFQIFAFKVSIVTLPLGSSSVVTKYFLFFRNAYLKLSKELHPDTNQGKSEKESQEVHNKVYFSLSLNPPGTRSFLLLNLTFSLYL